MKPNASDLENHLGDEKIWNRRECHLWTLTLFVGTCALYSARVALPIAVSVIAKEYLWSKTDSGVALSCFFWGYALTQIIAGQLADSIGGEKILKFSTVGWSLLTFFTPQLFDLSYATNSPMLFIIIFRFMIGVTQAFHLPSVASLTSHHLAVNDKGRIFGICSAGSHLGTALTGAIGSVLLEVFGWRVLFHFVGFTSLLWWTLLHYLTSSINSKFDPEESVADANTPLINGHRKGLVNVTKSESGGAVPWTVLLTHTSFWAAAIAQYTGANAYYMMFSWLPSFFADNFPTAKSVIYNVVPSIAIVITSLWSPFLAAKIFNRIHSLTQTRKLMEGVSLCIMAFCLLITSRPLSFKFALMSFTFAMAARGLHHGGVAVNVCDFAPQHTGSVFGIFNAFSALTGFIGVYVAGYILHETNNNWAFVFIFTSMQCLAGAVIYSLFGTANRII